MSFGVYEILLKSKKVRVFSNEVILKSHKNINNIKPLKLKSTATVEYIAYYNNKNRQVDIHKIKDKYKKTNITLSNFEEINKDKITSSLDYLNQKEKKKKVQLPDLDKVQNNLDYTEELLDFQKELINNEVISRNPYNYQALMGLKNPAKENEKKGSDKEGNILKRVLNYYLYELGLTPLKEIENYTPNKFSICQQKGTLKLVYN